ncbi:MAG: WG repeat-containing protein [Defluviitaleaceae bacterium]|nr:WG repeat-containing protein [Defluviitaleaceae bacterium]
MNKSIKILTFLLCTALVTFTWNLFLTADARLIFEQNSIMSRARDYLNHGLYTQAIASFNEAIAVTEIPNPDYLYELAEVYYEIGDRNNYRSVLQRLIYNQTPPNGQSLADLYLNLYYLDKDIANVQNIILLLNNGWTHTEDTRLLELYVNYRYAFVPRTATFDYASIILNNAGRVRQGDKWGFVNSIGQIVISPSFDYVTNFIGGYVVVQNDGVLEIINNFRERQSVASFYGSDIKNFDGANFAIRLPSSNNYVQATWIPDNFSIDLGIAEYQFIGRPLGGVRITKQNNLWGIEDRSGRPVNLTSEHIYQSIAVDSDGRSFVGGRIFVNQGIGYYMWGIEGEIIAGPFTNAKPFFEENGLAAVSNGEAWGLVDRMGNMVIDFIYEDAQSTGTNLAPVKQNGLWGYISVNSYPHPLEDFVGKIVIEPQFLNAMPLQNGVGPVENYAGWFYIMMPRYN